MGEEKNYTSPLTYFCGQAEPFIALKCLPIRPQSKFPATLPPFPFLRNELVVVKCFQSFFASIQIMLNDDSFKKRLRTVFSCFGRR